MQVRWPRRGTPPTLPASCFWVAYRYGQLPPAPRSIYEFNMHAKDVCCLPGGTVLAATGPVVQTWVWGPGVSGDSCQGVLFARVKQVLTQVQQVDHATLLLFLSLCRQRSSTAAQRGRWGHNSSSRSQQELVAVLAWVQCTGAGASTVSVFRRLFSVAGASPR
jgi:hypothetical protein